MGKAHTWSTAKIAPWPVECPPTARGRPVSLSPVVLYAARVKSERVPNPSFAEVSRLHHCSGVDWRAMGLATAEVPAKARTKAEVKVANISIGFVLVCERG